MAICDNAAQRLTDDGFCIVEDVLEPALIAQLRTVTDEMLERNPPGERQRFTGSMLNWSLDARLVEVIAHEKMLGAIRELGFDRPRFMGGYVISKPAGGPALYWHQDWWGWDEAVSYTDLPAQIFVMVYLVNTSRANGCLRVIPGSHRRKHALHETGIESHSDAVRTAGPDSPMHQAQPDEIDVAVKAGDIVIGDSRVFHAAHANHSDARRTCITLWYIPAFDELSERLRAKFSFAGQFPKGKPEGWSEEQWSRVTKIAPSYEGSAEPANWNRCPDLERLE